MATRLAEIRARLEAATPGPWALYAGGGSPVISVYKGKTRGGSLCEIVHWSGFDSSYIESHSKRVANADLIAHAPDDLAYLLDRVERLETALRRARPYVEHGTPDSECDHRPDSLCNATCVAEAQGGNLLYDIDAVLIEEVES